MMDDSEDSSNSLKDRDKSEIISGAYPRLSGLWLIFLLFVLLSLGVGMALFFLKPVLSLSWINFIGYAGSMGVLIWILFRWKVRAEGSFRFSFVRPRFSAFVYVTLMTVSMGVMLDVLSGWLPPVPDWFEEIVSVMMQPDLPSFLTVTFLAAFLEEMLCRGIILDGLLKTQSPFRAILWASFFFALMHLNPWQAVPGFAAGLLMGWLYWKTHSLWLPVWVHFLNNGMAFAFAFFTGNNNISLRDLIPDLLVYGLVCLASVCVFLLSVTLLSEKKLLSNEAIRK